VSIIEFKNINNRYKITACYK